MSQMWRWLGTYLSSVVLFIDCQKPALGNTLELKIAHSDLEIDSMYNEKAAYDKGCVTGVISR